MNTQKKDMLNKEQQLQQQDTSNTTDRRESKYEKHDVENTPFIVLEEPVTDFDSEYIVVLGKYRMNLKPFDSLEEAVEDAKAITWERIIQVAGILIESNAQMEKEKINNIQVHE